MNPEPQLQNPPSPFSVYFIRGGNPHPLPESHQLQIYSLLSHQPYTSSHLLYNPQHLVHKVTEWRNKLSHIIPYYAMKANHYEGIMQDLVRNGVKIDVGSQYQIRLCEYLGVKAEDIIYSNTMKCQLDLAYGEKYGIKLTVADSIGELEKIKKWAPSMRVLWRIAIKEKSDDLKINNFFNKFGDQLQNDQAIKKRMTEISAMGINLKGIHFNTGPQKYKTTGFDTAIKLARKCIEIGRQCGHEMSVMNLGGGFPAGQITEKLVEELKVTKGDGLGYEVIAEPGRFYSSDCFYLLARVIGKKQQNGRMHYYLNQSTYQSFRLAQQESLHLQSSTDHFYSKVSPSSSYSYSCSLSSSSPSPKCHPITTTHTATIFGMTCSRNDILTNQLQVPDGLDIGDWLCFGGMGAYTVCFSSNYNGMKEGCGVVELGKQKDKDKEGSAGNGPIL